MQITPQTILGKRLYKTEHPYFFEDDLKDPEKLLFILYEVDCGEAMLTKEGFYFLNEFYGEAKLIELIQDDINQGVDYSFKDKDSIRKWLKNDF